MSFIFLLFLSVSQAGYLRIVSESNLQLKQSGSAIELRGSYTIRNEGNEEAKEVWPELNLDKYQWKGFPQDLPPGESHTWELRKKLTSHELCEQVSPQCPLAMPSKGQFLIRGFKHYQDRNGYLFVLPDVVVLNFPGESESSELGMKLRIEERQPKEFLGSFELTNKSDQDLKVQANWLLPREMEVLNGSEILEVQAQGEILGNFVFRNRSGLPGSEYLAIGTAQWVENSERKAISTSAAFQIEKPSNIAQFLKKDRKVLFWTLWTIGVGLIFMWIFWIRPLRK